jgi:hypothetical protein
MGLIDTLIVTSCVGLSGMQRDACNKALTAGSKQSGIENNMDTAEKKTLKNIERDSRDTLGNTTVDVIAGTAIVAKTVADKAATVKLPNLGICNTMVLKVNHEKSLLSLEWKY